MKLVVGSLRVFLDFQEAGRTLGPFFELQLPLQEVVNLFPQKILQSPQGNQGGGFKYFLFSSLFGEMIHFDSYFSNGLETTNQKFLKKNASI